MHLARRFGYLSVTLLAGVAAVCGIAACGVSTEGSPHAIVDRDVPFGLLATTTTTTMPSAQPSQALIEVFLVSSMHLVASNQVVSAPVDLSSVLSALLSGPSDLEAFLGEQTDIPTGTVIRSARITGTTATIDLSDDFTTATGQSQILAIAQIVYTVTQIAGIDQVSFELNGASTEIPSADGTLLQRPVTRLDYASLAPGIPAAGSP